MTTQQKVILFIIKWLGMPSINPRSLPEMDLAN
jgi:hypothetical protein